MFSRQAKPSKLCVQVDSNHAGDGGYPSVYDNHDRFVWRACIEGRKRRQSTIALSTGESEYYALVKGGSVGRGLQALLEDFQVPISVVVE